MLHFVKNLEYQLDSSVLNKIRELEQIKLEIIQKQAILDELRLEIENLDILEITMIEIQKETCNLLEEEIDILYDKLRTDYLRNNQIITDVENGIVYEVDCTEGDSIDAGHILIAIIDLDSLYVEASVTEEFIKDISFVEPAKEGC